MALLFLQPAVCVLPADFSASGSGSILLDEGFSIMAEDAEDENEKKMLLYMAEGAELGDTLF